MAEGPDAARVVRRGSVALVRLLPRVHRGLTAALALSIAAGAALTVIFIVATGRLIGNVPGAVRDGLDSDDGNALVGWLAVAAAAFALDQMLGPVRQAIAEKLGRLLDGHLRRRLMAAMLRPSGIAHLEDPEMLDRTAAAQGVGLAHVTPGDAVLGVAENAAMYLQLLGAAVLVATWEPLAAVALLAANLFARGRVLRESSARAQTVVGEGGALRRADWFRDLALTAPAAKETRIFGLGHWLVERMAAQAETVLAPMWRAQRGGGLRALLWFGPLAVATLVSFLLAGRAAIDGDIGLAEMAIVAQGIAAASTWFVTDGDLLIQYGSAAVDPALALEDELERQGPAQLPATAAGNGDVRFEGVRFAYPGDGRPVLDGLDLTIPAGTSLAVVGVNGAGKTTLVKLLAGLYAPDAGRVSGAGRVAAIFQDFLRYELPLAENVGFGAAPEQLARAADRAGATDIAERVGWGTVLSRAYEGGTDLSGGQWQRVALARALLAVERGADVLVLDEPTANLDVRAEAETFNRLLDATSGVTTLLISHRFATVRRADRICVLENGRIAESGTHDELMAAGGRYAEMFSLQAARFEDG
jgi:ATP-binding cassette subfamily B protein